MVGRPHTLVSRLIGLIMCVTLEMARFILRGVFVRENARLTRRPNLHTKSQQLPRTIHKELYVSHGGS